jgi:two-component system, NarL family, nitrate/nitrite response regulator NarL
MPDDIKNHCIHVLIADSTRIHTQLLAEALRRDAQLRIVLAGPTVDDVVRTSKQQPFDVAIISSSVAETTLSGLTLLRTLRDLHPDLRVIALLDSSRPETIVEAFRAGARGILSREESLDTLCKCVHRVYEGQVWANSNEINKVLEAFAACPSIHAVNAKGVELLSKRETEIVNVLAEGLTNREIADQLGLSPHTVKNYLFRIFDKLGVSSRVELLSLTMTNHSAQHPESVQERKDCTVCQSAILHALQNAASQGFVVAQCALAHLYRVGQGVPRDLGQAYKWHVISEAACEDLPDELVAARREIGAELGPDQMIRAEQDASLWLEASQGQAREEFLIAPEKTDPKIKVRRDVVVRQELSTAG